MNTQQQMKLERCNNLVKEIKDLEYFIHVLGTHQTIRGGDKKDLKFSMIVTTHKELRLFANRYFGWGRSGASITFPDSIIEDMSNLSQARLKKLKDELDSLIK